MKSLSFPALMCAAIGLAAPLSLRANVVNGDFETGDLTGWTLAGQGAAKDATFGVTPTGGTYMGFIDTTGNSTVFQPGISTFLGVSVPGVNGSALQQSITVNAGDTLSFDWNFVTSEIGEDPMFNDFCFYSIDSTAHILAIRNTTTFDTVSPPAGYNGQSGWSTATYTFTAAGTYSLGFGTLNVGDSGYDSALLLDNITLPDSAPEPATGVTLALLVPASLRRRRGSAERHK